MSAADTTRNQPRTVQALAALVGASVEAPAGFDPGTSVESLDTVDRAGPRSLTFVGNAKYARMLETSAALAAVVSADIQLAEPARARAILRVKSADLAMIAILERFAEPEQLPPVGVDPTARIHPSATIGAGVRIGAFVSVGAEASVGDGTALFDGVRIYPGARVGAASVLHSNVVIRERCLVGNRVILASGVVIGTDGFGYRPSADGRGIAKVPHIGNVVIEDDVEIGANSCVDRGKFGATRVGAGTKIDNLCQIGHNVEIGRCVVISGLTGVAGSCRIGDGCRIGGGTGIADHLSVGRGASLAARSGVMSDVPDGETWGGFPAQDFRLTLREMALIRKLPEWHRQLKHLLEAPKTP
ncbi:MAG: UDP-3-O-(3-hydroxymyristoyl)glucosamine N-acyltransferase [Planctomycetota bacterium]